MSKARRKHVFFIVLFLLAAGVIVWATDVPRRFADQQLITETVDSWGAFGPVAFVALNVLQVIVAPIPGTALGIAGGYLFGVWYGFALNMIGLLIGSLIAFKLARAYGKPFIDRLVGPKTRRMLQRTTKKYGMLGLLVIFLFPFLPDDALCFVAGMTPIRTRMFMLIVLLGRFPAALVATLTGAGLVDLSLRAWIFVAVASVVLLGLWLWQGERLIAGIKRLLIARGGHLG